MTKLSLTGIDPGPDGTLVFNFLVGGKPMSWEFAASSFQEFVALLLGGRMGAGNDVHFDDADVSFEEPVAGQMPGRVCISIGSKVRIVAPAPRAPGAGEDSAARPKQRRGGSTSA